MSIVIQLPKFEGPLALLLYLIRKEEMDIMDIKIHEITKQYLEYIKLIKEFDLEVAGEFIAMASTLIQIKSRMLLPQYNEQGEIVENEDPRKELVQKLLEYQKYQEAAKLLYDRPLLGRDIWVRGLRESLAAPEDEIILEENALFSLISAYRKVAQSAKKKVHQVAARMQSIANRILEMKNKLVVGVQVRMSELLQVAENEMRHRLITFLSLLELGKMGLVQLYQTDTYGEIYITTLKPIETDVISRVEEYDALHSEETAQALFASVQKEEVQTDDDDDEFSDAEVPAGGSQLSLEAFEGTGNEELISIEDMASDDEILQAELALAGNDVGVVSQPDVLTKNVDALLEADVETSLPAIVETSEVGESNV